LVALAPLIAVWKAFLISQSRFATLLRWLEDEFMADGASIEVGTVGMEGVSAIEQAPKEEHRR
jgi:hypothetical protein